MFFKNYHILFFMLLTSGSVIAISANSWFTCWMGLEINLMSMIPLMLINLKPASTEAAIKYFLAQAMGSIILIFSLSMNFISEESVSIEIFEPFIFLSLCLKAGIAPFHFWFPQVANNLNWTQCFLLFSWQKIAPLILLTSFNLNFITLVSMISALTGAISGFNQIILKLILTYSSISHSGWMLIACTSNMFSWLIYFLIYCLISFAIIFFFQLNFLKKVNEIFKSSDSSVNKTILYFNILSLGGLPPLLGFSAKMSVILIATKWASLMIFLPLIMSSVISLFFYMRMIYNNLMTLSSSTKINFFNEKKSFSYIYTLSMILNISSPLIFLTL